MSISHLLASVKKWCYFTFSPSVSPQTPLMLCGMVWVMLLIVGGRIASSDTLVSVDQQLSSLFDYPLLSPVLYN